MIELVVTPEARALCSIAADCYKIIRCNVHEASMLLDVSKEYEFHTEFIKEWFPYLEEQDSDDNDGIVVMPTMPDGQVLVLPNRKLKRRRVISVKQILEVTSLSATLIIYEKGMDDRAALYLDSGEWVVLDCSAQDAAATVHGSGYEGLSSLRRFKLN